MTGRGFATPDERTAMRRVHQNIRNGTRPEPRTITGSMCIAYFVAVVAACAADCRPVVFVLTVPAALWITGWLAVDTWRTWQTDRAEARHARQLAETTRRNQ